MDKRILTPIRTIFTILSIFILFFGCNDKNKVPEAVLEQDVNLEVSRFDREFANASDQDIPKLKERYPYLFPSRYPDSVWVSKLHDTLQQSLLMESDKVFGDFNEEREELELFFKHVLYYFPNTKIPKVITVTTDVDYANRIILADSLLFIGVDNYLGADHRFYSGFPNYTAQGLEREYLISDVAGAFAKKWISPPSDRTFLSRIIAYGKELYLKDILVPWIPDERKIGYSEEDLTWAIANEEPIWRYFIENELLYSTDVELNARFLDPAPFSKFGLELDNESPGRLGRYMGWQIVRTYAEKTGKNIKALLETQAREIFEKSNYKPKK